jgi:6-pyruvoyltetrahydropterin/6-carboxytetrahydropterin synthase
MRLNSQRNFKVRVDGIQFAAAHFATFGGECEPLHGHNYEVAAELEGTLAEDSWVIDFRELKTILRELCDVLDHRFLLQRRSKVLEIDSNDSAWKVRTPARVGYVLPKTDVVALEIDNTTSERLAEWLTAKLWKALDARAATNIASMVVEVREGPDQRAFHSSERLPQE